jgi:polysaccharide pyruvyl transferase WcaK-like protein
VTSTRPVHERADAALAAARVGLFGLLGQGNLGNDASLEAVLGYLRAEHPELTLDALCTGSDQVTARYGIRATPLHGYRPTGRKRGLNGLVVKGLVALSLCVDSVRLASWVRRHDVVIVPGMGVLEVTIPQRPWQTPYFMFLLTASGRLFRTKVGLVSVGSSVVDRRLTRWLIVAAARLAYYRSFRDEVSRAAMHQMGLDTAGDAVYPDVAFSRPLPQAGYHRSGVVGVGLMTYYGRNEDRGHAPEIYAGYVAKMKQFVAWLVDSGRPVRLLVGDVEDERVVREVLADIRSQRPALGPGAVIAEPVSTVEELIRQIDSVDIVVATRFHNVAFALTRAKPTVSLGYAVKHDALMAEMGLSDYCHSVRSLDVARLIEQFTDIERQADRLRPEIMARCGTKARLVNDQFCQLSAALLQNGQHRQRSRVPRGDQLQ